jgi:hypothetical protein
MSGYKVVKKGTGIVSLIFSILVPIGSYFLDDTHEKELDVLEE